MKLSYENDKLQRFQEAHKLGNPGSEYSNTFFQELLNDQVGRDFFNRLAEQPEQWSFPKCQTRVPYQWIQFLRLPVPPAQSESYDVLNKWQSVLSAAHSGGNHVAFLLTRSAGKTSIYLGAYDPATESGKDAITQLEQTTSIHMQGASFARLTDDKAIWSFVESLHHTGIVTGLPSSRFQKEDTVNLLQTMDRLTYGIRDTQYGVEIEHDYAVLVLAEPAEDQQIVQLMNRFTELRSDIHKYVAVNVSAGTNDGRFKSNSVGGNIDVGGILGALASQGSLVGAVAAAAVKGEASLNLGTAWGKNFSTSTNFSHDERNFAAAACEELLGSHMKRLQNGRSLGFWNTGVYVLGDASETVDTVLGMLRSIYAGKESYIEPIRVFNAGTNAGVHSYLRNMHLLPLPGDTQMRKEMAALLGIENGWHVFGPLYESFSTPMNTEELSLATSLPRRDVPGLRFVRNAVKLTANPPQLAPSARKIDLGTVYDMGVPTGSHYYLNLDEMVRHVLNDGLTGYGKSTTTHRILEGLAQYQVPWLVIEPVKTDYVEWAMEYNRTCAPEDRIAIYMPGYETFFGEKLETMRFNPFQPCVPEGAPLNIQGHLDALASLLTASVSMGEVLPLLMKEALQDLAGNALGVDKKTGRLIANSNQADPDSIQGYPKFSQLIRTVQDLMRKRGYAAENHQNLTAAMETRIKSLLLGWKEDFFDAPMSTPGEDLFGRKVIINLIGIESDEDKAFFMSLILRALNEYRSASYYYLPGYREEMSSGDKLKHFTVVEEAHRLISAPTATYAGEANPQAATASLFSNMLREVRKWGEGLMIVDQQPSHLIPDAIKNTNLKIIHRMPAEDDRRAVGGCMGLNEEQMELIAVLGKGEVILSSENDDAALWVKVHYRQ